MNEVKTPKKPVINFWIGALMVLLCINIFLKPYIQKMQIQDVKYSTFISQTEKKQVKEVEVQENKIVFTLKDDDKIYETAKMNDPELIDRLSESGAKFSGEINETMSPLASFLLTWILPILLFMWLGKRMQKSLMDKSGGGAGSMMFGMGKSNAKIYVQSTNGIKFSDVAGEDEAKENLQEIVDYLHDPNKYKTIGASMPKGVLLVGPPGTGKTSIAKSLSRALKKPYVRISLGGVRDEAEIRGHRKTYVGAMPGRIANGIKQAGVKNPLMLLDEIDKVSNDYKGDTFSALLEVLDGEQNNKFVDHYLEVPMDLSEVLFITTANSLQTIPRPLLDRMEVIEVTSYTENEKLHIAQEHLVPKQIEKHGLKADQVTISKNAIWKMARNYTKEAGVRQLERKIGDICRKVAMEILEKKKTSIHVTERNLEHYLGKELYSYQMANEEDEVGIVRGLAWTSVGGDTLQIEVNVMPGEGEILLTGQLGDVMKESARTGISYIRSVSKEHDIADDFFKKHDIHIHIPEGAVPKDGPSAGITMATAIMSAVTGRKVRADLAMTGEITLRGRVLPIGGLKEKLLAAKNAGMKTVLVPAKNERDVEEISTEITKGLEIKFVTHMDEVLKEALV